MFGWIKKPVFIQIPVFDTVSAAQILRHSEGSKKTDRRHAEQIAVHSVSIKPKFHGAQLWTQCHKAGAGTPCLHRHQNGSREDNISTVPPIRRHHDPVFVSRLKRIYHVEVFVRGDDWQHEVCLLRVVDTSNPFDVSAHCIRPACPPRAVTCSASCAIRQICIVHTGAKSAGWLKNRPVVTGPETAHSIFYIRNSQAPQPLTGFCQF